MRISDWSSDVCSSDLFDVRFITKLVICDRVFQDRVVTRCHNGETVEKKMFASQIAYVIDWVFERTLGYGQAKVQVAFLHPLKRVDGQIDDRSEEHTSELQSLMRISYAVFCLKKKT